MLALALAIASTVAIGSWVAHRLEEAILLRSSGVASVYISDLVSPLVQDMAATGQISAEGVAELESLLVTGALRLRVVAMKIWSENGTIVYASDPEIIGRRFAPGRSLLNAFNGTISSEINEPSEESSEEFGAHSSIFEVYAPVYDQENGQVIAVAEFYEDASELERVVAAARFHSWMFTFFVLCCNVLGYFLVVHGGSKTIEQQRIQLTQRIDELSQAMEREKALRDHIERGAQKVFDENERFLRALGSDLHDGPAQLIGLALLKLDRQGGDTDEANLHQARAAITQAMREVRAIAAGLLLPDISGQTLEACIEATVRNHEAKTGTKVALKCSDLEPDCPDRLKVCVCRFIQEGLANSFRHAGGIGQRVHVDGEQDFIRVIVADSGPGISRARSGDDGPHLGLISLRDRLESVHGTMTVSSRPRRGTRLVARLPLRMEKTGDV